MSEHDGTHYFGDGCVPGHGTAVPDITELKPEGSPANRLLAVNPVLVESDAEKLLLEWFEQWEDRGDMPTKMDNGLHVRTAMYWVEKNNARAVEIAEEVQ